MVIGVPLLMYFMQDRMIFHPQRLSEAQRTQIRKNPAVEELIIPAEDGRRLHAWHIKGDPLVLYFGGNAEDVSWMIDEALQRTPGVGWLLTSYRGYGGSEGEPSEVALSADALQWYDYVAREYPGKYLTLGRSLGSGVAVHLAAKREVAGVILAAPYSSLVHVAKHYYPWLPVRFMLRHKFDSMARAPHIRAPLLCLVAGRDEVIPPVLARRLYDAWGGPKQWVALEEAGHNTTDSHPMFWKNVTDFLVKMRP